MRLSPQQSTPTVERAPEQASSRPSNPATSTNRYAQGDSQLVQNFLPVLQAKNTTYNAPVQIPANSILGQWRTQLAIALKNPDFQNWIKEKGIAPASIVIFPDTNAISASINHQRVTFNLNDNSGWSTVAGPILAASKVITSGGTDTVHYDDAFSDTTDLGKVALFYGLPDMTKAEVDELKRTGAFPSNTQTGAYNSPAARDEQALVVQQRAVANIYARHERSTHPVPPGDARLVEGFTTQWQKKVSGGKQELVSVPPETILGQWLGLYQKHLEQPVFQHWLNEQGIDLASMRVVPATGTMTATVNGETKTFSLTDNSGWRQVSGPLLDAGKVIAPEPGQSLFVSFANGETATSMKVIAKFYAEPTPPDADTSRQRISQLNREKTFNAPENDKQSPQALEVQRSRAEKFYTEAPQKLAFTKLASDMARAIPDIRSLAKGVAEDIIKKALPDQQNVDADKLWLIQGGTAESSHPDASRSGWFFSGEPTRAETLTDAVIRNFSDAEWAPGNYDSGGGIFKDGPGQGKKNGYGAHNEFPLTPSVFMKGVWDADFQSLMSKKIDEFWDTQGDSYRTVAKGNFVYEARQQLKAFEAKTPEQKTLQPDEHKFTRDDYRLVMKAINNVPVDENTPVTLEQLQAEAPAKGKLRAHAFDINGWGSSDIIRFAEFDDGQGNYQNNRRDGKQVLYIPGANPAFLRFDSLNKMDDWVVEQAKDPKKREALTSHFSLKNRQDGVTFLGKSGVDSSLAHLANGDWRNSEGITIDRSDVKIEGDIFSYLKEQAKARMTSDADSTIKSDSEVSRDTALKTTAVAASLLGKLALLAAPVAAAAGLAGIVEISLGAEKTASGDTQAERKDGAWKTFDGALNTLFSANARGGAGKDPFALPEDELPSLSEQAPDVQGGIPTEEPVAGTSSTARRPSTTPGIVQPQTPSTSLIKMSEHAVANGERLIEGASPDALGVYRIQNKFGTYKHFVRYTDETGNSKVFEIESRYKTGDSITSIISPRTGRAVMRINAARNGEWMRAPGDGGMPKFWKWGRPASPPASEVKIPDKISDNFLNIEGNKIPEAQELDKYLKFKEETHYEFSVRNEEIDSVLKTRFGVSWTIKEDNFSVDPTERATSSSYGTSNYSSIFIQDINRNPYTIITKNPEGTSTVNLDGTGASAEGIKAARVNQFEAAIPDADLRAKISEVAHQGSVAPATITLNLPGESELTDGYTFKADDTHYYIDYAPGSDKTTVRVVSKGHLSNADQDLTHVPNVEVSITRTFTITESNEIDNRFAIGKEAPSRVEVSVITPLSSS
ncbi:hypothetical protein GIR22_17780 [Pseudomonas sp. CCM 7891]|uniref:Dermonecrotic toxin N-terminal domain-containing protein n=1 Tax=Pseudomonas karstica TaxID=1055468 RepID=A0A7X2RUW0_9PSED|nr:DUF6543 domain-containing protein [Pseudomonas karstica]MTD20976.1 hypothetical protein [Pseudomonas karstica]